MVEMVEPSYGNFKPKDDDTVERSKFIAMMFMEGVDEKQCGHPLKNLETDYSLGNKDVCPEGIEDALQVLTMYSEKIFKKKAVEAGEGAQLRSFALARTCWEYGSTEHHKKECNKWKNEQASKEKIKQFMQNHVQINPEDGPACMSSIA